MFCQFKNKLQYTIWLGVPYFFFVYNISMKLRDSAGVCVCNACIFVCASERVCILFMARNQLSLAHNGNVNSPERPLSHTGRKLAGSMLHLFQIQTVKES